MIHPIREAPHLEVVALAGVSPDGIRQRGYLVHGLEYVRFYDATAGIATGQKTAWPQPARLTERAIPVSGLHPFHLQSFLRPTLPGNTRHFY